MTDIEVMASDYIILFWPYFIVCVEADQSPGEAAPTFLGSVAFVTWVRSIPKLIFCKALFTLWSPTLQNKSPRTSLGAVRVDKTHNQELQVEKKSNGINK